MLNIVVDSIGHRVVIKWKHNFLEGLKPFSVKLFIFPMTIKRLLDYVGILILIQSPLLYLWLFVLLLIDQELCLHSMFHFENVKLFHFDDGRNQPLQLYALGTSSPFQLLLVPIESYLDWSSSIQYSVV